LFSLNRLSRARIEPLFAIIYLTQGNAHGLFGV
jgi:hypothetical protein